MIKTIFQFSIASIILCLTTSQVNAPNQQKQLTVTLNEQDWGVIMYVINKSTAAHNTVSDVQDALIKQLNDSTLQKKIKEKLK